MDVDINDHDTCKRLDARSEPQDTIFYLTGVSPDAKDTITNYAQSPLFVDTETYGPALRVTLSSARTSHLVQIGSDKSNDIVIPSSGGHASCCQFGFNNDSGELLLIDKSLGSTATLQYNAVTKEDDDPPLDTKPKGQSKCAVILKPSSKGSPRSYRLIVPENIEFLIWPPMEHRPVDLALRRPFSITDDDIDLPPWGDQCELACTSIEVLGKGAEGSVEVVVINKTGAHLARKTLQYRYRPKKYIRRTVRMQDLLMDNDIAVRKSYIVPCLHFRGPTRRATIDVFMPIYWCSLADLINGDYLIDDSAALYLTTHMLLDMSEALSFRARLAVVHRDIKPDNILYCDGHLYLAGSDFGCSKEIDENNTDVGTKYFKSPEARAHGKYTCSMDVFSLGLTAVACILRRIPSSGTFDGCMAWTRYAQESAKQNPTALGRAVSLMLQDEASDRLGISPLRTSLTKYLHDNKARWSVCSMPSKDEAKRCVIRRRGKEEMLGSTVPGPVPSPPCYSHIPPDDTQHCQALASSIGASASSTHALVFDGASTTSRTQLTGGEKLSLHLADPDEVAPKQSGIKRAFSKIKDVWSR